ncbi:MAG: SPASM domain-containing protein, partial [Candidatus Odinarchaeota archaeon]
PANNYSDYYQKIIKNLKELVKNDINIKIGTVVTNNNISNMEEFINELISYKVKAVQIDPVKFSGRAANFNDNYNMYRPKVEEYIEIFEKCLEIGQKKCLPVFNQTIARMFRPAKFFCDLQAAKNAVAIDAYGNILHCCEIQGSNNKLKDHFTNGNISTRLIRNYQGYKSKKKECNDCFAKYFCAGGCPINNYYVTGNLKNVDEYYCKIAALSTEVFIKNQINRILRERNARSRC